MPLVDRDAELAALAAALDSAQAGSGSLVVIEGPAGIGKTALLEEARHRASASGLRVLTARGTPLEGDLAHGLVRQLLESPVREADADGRAGLLSGAARMARAVVQPGSGGPVDLRVDRRGPVVHGLFWLTANLAAVRPLLLAIDDVHWSDPASLRYLAYLTHRLDGLSVVIVATVRTGEDGPGRQILDELTASRAVRVLRPDPLGPDAVAELVRRALPDARDPDLARACRDRTGGVPFLVGALLDELAGGMPDPVAMEIIRVTSRTVGHATLLRLSRLGAVAVPVAGAIAVLGRRATVPRVAQLAGLDSDAVLRGVDRLTAAHILAPERPLAFVHPIVQASVYGELPAGARSLTHARAARLLADEGLSPEEVASHLLLTEPGTAAVSVNTVGTLRAAAAQAQERGAPESSITYLRRAAAEPATVADRGVIVHELACAEAMVRDERAATHFSQALQLTANVATRARIGLDLVETLMFAGRWREALAAADRTLAAAMGSDPETAATVEVFRAGMMANDPEHVDAFERDLPRLLALAARPGRAGTLMSALLASCAVCRGEPAATVRVLADRGLDGAHLMAGPDAEAWGPQAAATLAYLGELGGAMAAAEAMQTAAQHRGSVYGHARASALQALVSGLRGDLRSVEADLRSAFDLSRANGLVFSAPPLLRWSIDALLERPALDDLAGEVERIDLDPGLAASFSGAWLLEARGRLRSGRGDRVAACADLAACGATMSRLHVSNPIVSGWRGALALALPEADRGTARRLAREEFDHALAAGSDRTQGVALRAMGQLADGDERVARLVESVHVLHACDAPLELARSELQLGRAQRRAGRRAEAGESLREAMDLAHRCGAERLGHQAQDELHLIGARPRRWAVTGVDSLTPSEARVAEQAASGMTNREIAQALFVTAKTVENQLGRVYDKLGVHNRRDLADAVAVTG